LHVLLWYGVSLYLFIDKESYSPLATSINKYTLTPYHNKTCNINCTLIPNLSAGTKGREENCVTRKSKGDKKKEVRMGMARKNIKSIGMNGSESENGW